MKSLKVSIYLHIMLLIVITSLATGVFSFVVAVKEIGTYLNDEVEQLSERAAQSLAFPYWNLDSTGVSEIIDAQIQNANMYAIILTEASDMRQFVPGIRKLVDGEVAYLLESEKLHTPYMHSADILFEGEKLGTVTVLLSDEIMRALLLRNQIFTTLTELLVLLLLAFPISYMIANRFINPVESVAENFQAVVESGFKTSVQPVTEKELRKISDTFEEVRLTLLKTFRKIRDNEKDITTTLNSITDGIIGTDVQGVIQRMNPLAESLTGWSEEDAIGISVEEVLSLKERGGNGMLYSVIENIIKSTADKNSVSAYIQDKSSENGESRSVDIVSSSILDEDGEKSGIVIVVRDITEQLRVEEELNQRRKMESLGQLSGGVAHDFNNMLGGIIGFSELILGNVESGSDTENYAEHIVEAAQSAADLTAKLLAFSRKGKVISTPFSIHKSCETALSLLSRTIDKNIVIKHTLNAEFEQVTGDPSQIQNCILNLCINAKDAMPKGGDLTVETTNTTLKGNNELKLPEGDYITVKVTDTGTGIPQELQSKIFEPFFTTKEVGKGTGLGLAAVYGSVQNHNGEITVESALGEGTTFTIYLPVEKDAQIHHVTSKYEEIRQLKKRVLVVDDERIIRVMLDKYVSELGGEVMQAADGIEAVALFREKHENIDLVILDMVMPNMNGDTCFFELQKIDPSVPVLLSSGFDKNSAITTLLDSGAAGYLHKPFNLNELWELLYKNTH